MLAVRFFGRLPVASSPLKRTSCLRLFAGLASGGSALTLAWQHCRLHAASPPPKFDPNKIQAVVRDLERKKASSSDKFDWKLFWYYLRPQIWIIACATAVSQLQILIE